METLQILMERNEITFDHLREAVSKRLENDAEAEARLVEILARAATELQQRS